MATAMVMDLGTPTAMDVGMAKDLVTVTDMAMGTGLAPRRLPAAMGTVL